MKNLSKFAAALVGVLAVVPFAASADTGPVIAASMPSYAHGAPNGEQGISGRITSVNGKYGLDVRDSRGYVDNVEMHQGTVINPTGLSLQPGMKVWIVGYANGSTFDANAIDTPYHFTEFLYSSPWPYPYWGWGPFWW
jgi:hypothetical protein